MKKIIVIVVVLVLLGVGVWMFTQRSSEVVDTTQDQETASDAEDTDDESRVEEDDSRTVIGRSVEGRDITAYHYGSGDLELLFVGGIHGGYSWNTSLVAYELMDYLEADEDIVPNKVTVTVVPVLNPDGLATVVGTTGRFSAADAPTSESETVPGRFNANNVDLNRNFDCDWQKEGTWRNTPVDGGSSAFSEPESRALQTYIENNRPRAVVVWYSAVGGVFASNCHEGVLPETNTLTQLYAEASGYPAYEDFNFYEITGDAVNWMAKQQIPAISVLLSTHTDVEWDKNRAGIEALLEHYAD